ncbi:MAG: 30S ribosomal protein S20 [Planctomycetota bacterium]
MAHSKQAEKRIRQNEKARLRNKAKSSAMKTSVKKLMAAVEAGDVQKAQELLPKVTALIDKAAKASVIHANKASRKKSQIARAVAGLSKTA